MSLKEEIEKTMRIKGKGIGAAVQTHFHYIQERKGEEGVKKVQERLKELGYSVDFEKIKATERVPLSLSYMIVLAAREVFDWEDKDIFDMGNNAPKYSFIVKMIMNYFLSAKKTFQESPKYWRKHYDVGELEAYKFSEEGRYMIIRLKNECPPTICTFYCGYFLRVAQYAIKSEKVTIEETKCQNKGDSYHEFMVRWE